MFEPLCAVVLTFTVWQLSYRQTVAASARPGGSGTRGTAPVRSGPVQQERPVNGQERRTGVKMTKHKTIGLAVLSAAGLWLASLRAQELPISGLYQIISGTYTECCGFAGP